MKDPLKAVGFRIGKDADYYFNNECGSRWPCSEVDDGFNVDDFDFDKGIINVNHTLMHYDKGKGRGSAYKINPPKTKSSRRTVPMLPKVKNALLREKEYQKLIGIKCNVEIDGYTNFVFVNSNAA